MAQYETGWLQVSTLNDYHREANDDLKVIQERAKTALESNLSTVLGTLGFKSDDVKDLSRQVLIYGMCLDGSNPDRQDDKPQEEVDKLVKRVNNISLRHRSSECICHVLQISADEKEQEKRMIQLRSIVEQVVDDEKYKATHNTCLTYREMLESIEKYLNNFHDDDETHELVDGVIIFNSHGSKNGALVFSGEKKPIDINKVTQDVYKIRLGLKDELTGFEYPYRVRLVYAQCWSHLASVGECNINGFDVVTLSTFERPKTYNTYKSVVSTVNGVEITSKEWHHFELEKWFRKYKSEREKALKL